MLLSLVRQRHPSATDNPPWAKKKEQFQQESFSLDDSRVLSVFLSKRFAFKYEEEVRLFAHAEDSNENLYPYTIKHIDQFINSIELDPWTPRETVGGIESAIRYQQWNNWNKWDVNINRSSLYDEPSKEDKKRLNHMADT